MRYPFAAKRWRLPALAVQTAEQSAVVQSLETLVPGTVVWQGQDIAIRAPVNGAWFVEAWLHSVGLLASCKRGACDDTMPHPAQVDVEAIGSTVLEAAIVRGELREIVHSRAYSFQKALAGFAALRPYVCGRWNPGAGKTLGGLAAALAIPGDIVIVGPSKSRKAWRAQVPQYSHLETFCVMPKSKTRKRDETLSGYLARMRAGQKRAVVMVGLEVLADYFDAVQLVAPSVVIFDEIHYLSDSSRLVKEKRPPGGLCPVCGAFGVEPCGGGCPGERWVAKTTKGEGRITRSAAAMMISRLPSVQLRVALDGTPMQDGRPAALYSPLDLLMPDAWGSKSKFETRYADGHQGVYGWEAVGSSNVDELKARCSWFFHDVPRSVTHKDAPKFHFRTVWLASGQLGKADTSALAELRKVKSKPKLREALRAVASSQKRGAVLDIVRAEMETGAKVVVFGSRKAEVEKTGEKLRSMLAKKGLPFPVWIGHGDDSEEDRFAMVDAFASCSTACCLVGTGFAFGTSIDGLQCANFGHLMEIPENPVDFEQWMGRFDRNSIDGNAVETTCFVYFGSGTYDEHMVAVFTPKIGPIEEFLEETILSGMAGRLTGLDDAQKWLDSAAEKLMETEYDRLMQGFDAYGDAND